MNDTTLCWYCSKSYLSDEPACPHCGAANGNISPERAQAQAAEFIGMSADEEPMARYFIQGGL